MTDATQPKNQIAEALISWGVPALCSAVPFLAWFDVIASFLRSIGWRVVTGVVSLLIFGVVRLFWMWRATRHQYKKLQEDVQEDYHQYLTPVPGKGVYRDKRNNEIICPRCVAERNIPSPMYKIAYYAKGWHYTCGACQNQVPC